MNLLAVGEDKIELPHPTNVNVTARYLILPILILQHVPALSGGVVMDSVFHPGLWN